MKRSEITVVVAEDEPIILNNIIKKMERTDESIRVTGKAQNGRETLALLEEQVPDLLVTDIEMPGMNGLELISEVRRLYPWIHIVILSGYSNFEYARTAIKFGVDDYLLKPVSQEDLTAVLDKMKAAILTEKQQKERNILSKTLRGDAPEMLIPSSFSDGKFLMVLVLLGNMPSRYADAADSDCMRRKWEKIDFNSFFGGHWDTDHTWIIDEAAPCQKFIILHTLVGETRSALMAMQLSNFIRQSLPELPFHVLFHETPICYTQIWETARDMRAALPQYVSLYSQDSVLYPGSPKCPAPDQRQIRERVNMLYSLKNETSFLSYVTATLCAYASASYVQSATDDFIREVYHALPVLFRTDEAAAQAEMYGILSRINTCSSSIRMEKQLRASIEKVLQTQPSAGGSARLYSQLKHYIETNYSSRISLDDLSDRYGYSPSYINRLFKKECGMSPLQYQTEVRMEKAKELLSAQAGIDIKTVASNIGYEDARYFSRVFKNEVGTAPSEWVRNKTGRSL